MSKQFWAVIVVIVLIFIGVFALSGKKNSNNSSNNKVNSSNLSQHVEGQGSTGVKLVEYGDYQCPFCEAYYPIVKQVEAQYDQQIFFQFRNFPLTNLHPNAFAAARAAEAASLQGKFWQYHDLLYDNQSAWADQSNPSAFFKQYAQQLGLNISQFNSDFNSDKVDNTILADMNEGNKLGIQGTPTFYLDGKQINVGQNLSQFQQLINAEITKKTGAKTSG